MESASPVVGSELVCTSITSTRTGTGSTHDPASCRAVGRSPLTVVNEFEQGFQNFISELNVATVDKASRDHVMATFPHLIPTWYLTQDPCPCRIVERSLRVDYESAGAIGSQGE